VERAFSALVRRGGEGERLRGLDAHRDEGPVCGLVLFGDLEDGVRREGRLPRTRRLSCVVDRVGGEERTRHVDANLDGAVRTERMPVGDARDRQRRERQRDRPEHARGAR